MAGHTSTRARLALSSTVLLVGAAASACGGGAGAGGGGGAGGAPSDASEKEFCQTQSDLFQDLIPTDAANPQVPSDQEMAQAFKGWGDDLTRVGTPEGIPDDARAGFEALVDQIGDIDPEDFSIDKLEELSQGGAGASKATEKEATAFADYLTQTCGNPLEDLQMPKMPDSQ